jgi:hypothetical protein
MATQAELQNRNDHLEAELRRRDQADIAARTAALTQKNATDDARTLAAKTEAAIAEREAIRRGAWTSHLIKTGDPAEAVNFVALAAKIPADLWPPGTSPQDYLFTGGTLPADTLPDIAATAMGKMLNTTRET